jgi:2-furoyl-CoA dehydrogenase large subunit
MAEPAHGRNWRYVSQKRRPKEDRRFVAGKGKFVADIDLTNMKHVALVASPHPRANILGIDATAALELPGVHAVLTGAELARDTNSLYHGLDLPKVRWYPLAVGMTRYAGEWVAAVVADSRHIAEDGAELVRVDYEPLEPAVISEKMIEPDAPLVHPDHGSNVLFDGKFTWGPVEADFAAAPHKLKYRARWGRSSTVPIETFGVVARWNEADKILEVWASIQMPNYQEFVANALRLPTNGVRVHNDVDVGGSYGVKRGLKHTVIAGHLARKLEVPVRLIEDRLDNMSGGDAHGPDRTFDVELAFDGDGLVRSMRIRALDDVGAYPGRAPQQLAKPITALCGPYRVNSIAYHAISVVSNKTGQVPVRGFGQSPTNFMVETGIDRVARHLGLDRIEVRRRNFIRRDEFPWRIPTGSAYDSGDYHTVLDKALDLARYPELVRRRDEVRARGGLAGIGIATCLEPSGGNNVFEHLMNPKIQVTTFMEACEVRIDAAGNVTASMGTTTSGQGHETLVSMVIGEELERDPDGVRVVHADSLAALPTRSPVASRMAIMLGGAAADACRKLLARMRTIAAHALAASVDRLEYGAGEFFVRGEPSKRLTFEQVAAIAHRQIHRMPPGLEPGLQAIGIVQVPGGGKLPDAEGRVQLYPCFSFQAHVPFVEIDPGTGKVAIREYAIAHDCGTVINPDIVRGMIMGGIAHGIGAALYEKFEYDPGGQHLSGTFMDYVMPSAHEVPMIRDVEHCTPSPLTALGQKGSGEGGYLGAPAAVASAVNDALAPLGVEINELPLRLKDIEAAIHAKRTEPGTRT